MSMGLFTELGPRKVTPRYYQDEAVNAVRDEFIKGVRSTLLAMPTGSGKTMVFSEIARRVIEKDGRILVLAHRDELIKQAASKMDLFGVDAAIEKSGRHARALGNPDCVVGSVQTLTPGRLAREWPRDYFDLVVFDEGHRATRKNQTYYNIYQHFGKKARFLLVTATPNRYDEEPLLAESIAYEYKLWDAMTDPAGPYLCPLVYVQCDVDIDLRGLRAKGEDYTAADLEARIGPMVEILANAIRQEAEDRQTIVFTPQIKSSMAMGTALQSMGIRADYVYGDDPDRELKLENYGVGRTQMICGTPDLLGEGVDLPETAAIGLCFVTKSRGRYSQAVGRGTRLKSDGGNCRIIDFNYMTDEHDLGGPVKLVELFDTTHTDSETQEIAYELIRKDKQLPLTLAIEQAEEEHRRRTQIRIAAKEREVKYYKVSFNPLDVYERIGLPWKGSRSMDAVVDTATDRQVAFLKQLGVEGAENLSVGRASKLITELKMRMDKGLATHRQIGHLVANGVDPETARNMTKKEASAFLESKWGPRKKKPAARKK